MKLKEKQISIQLRKQGNSYGEINNKVKVSKSTLSLWLRDIKLSPEQENNIYQKAKQKHAYRLAKFNQQKRIDKTKEIIQSAKKEISSLVNNPLFLAGLMLYWAEGDKSDRIEHVKFNNSDPKMIRLMMSWFKKICKVPDEKFRIELHIHELHCRKNIEKYWSQVTQVPLNQFNKTQVKPTSLRQRKNKLYDGTCAIRVSSRDLFRRIKGWQLGFLEQKYKDIL